MSLGPIAVVILGALLVAIGMNMMRRTASMRGSMWKQEWTPDTGFSTSKGIFAQAGLQAMGVGGLLIVIAVIWAVAGS